jgi:DNA modification methylase
MREFRVLQGDVLDRLRELPDESVQCVVTSPPYWGLRDYGLPPTIWGGRDDCEHEWGDVGQPHHPGQVEQTKWKDAEAAGKGGRAGSGQFCRHCNAWRGCFGLEPTPELYVEHSVAIFREVRRVLRSDGVCFVNLGDSYAGSGPSGASYQSKTTKRRAEGNGMDGNFRVSKRLESRGLTYAEKKPIPPPGLKPKDLVGIPWRVAFALQRDGWWLRSEIIWCLSGGAVVYAKTQKGVMPMTIKDMARLDPNTVQLWNGEKWTQVLGWSKSARKGNELEIVLRSGERISCTPTHKFPTGRGLLDAGSLKVGDTLKRCRLPEPLHNGSDLNNWDIGWFVGLYIAEGSKSEDTIQIAGHAKEELRWQRLEQIARKYGGSATRTIGGNRMDIRLYGKILNAILSEFVSGRIAKDKCLAPPCWNYTDAFLHGVLSGYLDGDGHWDEKNQRWRLGFTRNYNLERDLRTLCARLGHQITLNFSRVKYNGDYVPTLRGEIRERPSTYRTAKSREEIVDIRKARCRYVYDIGVGDEPHLFSLASGILTHNSKPNPMPESVTDRPTKSHEQIFLLTKSAKYFWDAEAVREESICDRLRGPANHPCSDTNGNDGLARRESNGVRNIRTVWSVSTRGYSKAHFATFPPAIPERCIKAGTSEKGCCPECGAPWVRTITKNFKPQDSVSIEKGIRGHEGQKPMDKSNGWQGFPRGTTESTTTGWRPSCECIRRYAGKSGILEEAKTVDQWEALADTLMPYFAPVPCAVLDPFSGAGTTGLVALRLGRKYIGIELNPEYVEMARERILQDAPLFNQEVS